MTALPPVKSAARWRIRHLDVGRSAVIRQILSSAVAMAQTIASGEDYGQLLIDLTARLFDADGGAGLSVWNRAVGGTGPTISVWTSPGIAVPPGQNTLAARCAADHPGLAAIIARGTHAPVRVSDTVSLPQFWDTEVYHHMHGWHPDARYPMGAAIHVSGSSMVFLALHNRGRDFTDDEVAALGLFQRPVSRALAYRSAVDDCVQRLDQLTSAGGATLPAGDPRREDAEQVPRFTADRRPSRRELEVLRLVAAGYTNQQAGQRLGISERTVRKHLSAIYDKGSLPGRAAAAAWWQKHQTTLG